MQRRNEARYIHVFLASLFVFSSLHNTHGDETSPEDRPNIVWIWADNLAYRDLACYGNKNVKTPTIDQLAADGVKLTQYYVAHTVCSPSRAGFLTGRQPFRTGIVDVLRPDGPSGLPDDEITIAELLHDQGYATLAVGKWHLGDQVEYLPIRFCISQVLARFRICPLFRVIANSFSALLRDIAMTFVRLLHRISQRARRTIYGLSEVLIRDLDVVS